MVKANASKIELKDQISELNYVHINLINFEFLLNLIFQIHKLVI